MFRFEASPIFGLDTAADLQRCRELASRRVIAWCSLGRPDLRRGTTDHRFGLAPSGDQAETRDRLAERQARAAIALVRMGKAVRSCRCCGTVPTPGCGASSSTGSSLWEPTPSSSPPHWNVSRRPPDRLLSRRQQLMDAILFHPETSRRRALILALGTYGRTGCLPASGNH